MAINSPKSPRRNYKWDKSRSISKAVFCRWICVTSRRDLNESASRVSKQQERGLDKLKECLTTRNVPQVSEEALALMEDKIWQAMTEARCHQNPPLRPRSRTVGFWGAIVGGKRPGGPCQCLHRAKGPVQGKTPPRPWEKPSSAWM